MNPIVIFFEKLRKRRVTIIVRCGDDLRSWYVKRQGYIKDIDQHRWWAEDSYGNCFGGLTGRLIRVNDGIKEELQHLDLRNGEWLELV